MNYWVLISLLFLLCDFDDCFGQKLNKSDFVEILPTKDWKLLPGEKGDIEITFKIKDGFHIQADEVLEDHLIPTSLSTQAPEEIIISDPVFPDPFPFHLKNMNQEMMVFHKKLEVMLPIVIREGTKKGKYYIDGNLHYQVCDSLKCYFPRDFPFQVIIEVTRAKH